MKTKNLTHPALAFSAILLLAGCSLEPDYARPASPVPASWPEGDAYTKAASTKPGELQAASLGWRDFFKAEPLQRLIETALANNRDLRVATLNIEQARAQYRIQRADLFPSISADASGTRQRIPASLSSYGQSTTSSQYSVEAGVTSFEIDLFGRVRSLSKEALESYFATEEAQRSSQVSLVAEVANAYLTLQADKRLLLLTDQTLKAQEESLGLVRESFKRGISSQLDLSQAQTSVETARVNRALYTRQVAQDKNALDLLVGTPVDAGALGQADLTEADALLAELPEGLPSDLLERRPDIREAEHQLRAANADIGAARAAFFPKITLTGSGGTSSTSLAGLFDAGSGAWSFVPSISLPIFDAGKNQANLDVSKAQRDIYVAQYEKAIQTAFREVSDALAGRGTYTDQVEAQRALVKATNDSYDLAQLRYRRGIDSYLTVLDSQRSLYSSQQTLISIELERLSNLVTLYKVLGGGTVERTEALSGKS
ncbi:AdeC/AdeK/OprM family multidrug efflux complex outer membrane factor [Parvibaculum sp.]|uniref:AdeC/AdeK/OprM family multidrug efflux complex outer membrane factor n=1 Tax=Parvibaculum sp. TaxID=2024848 RepID=UPI002C7B545C|nr:AdeC/AdeK/OprM family multidrug efflux complex outer membrane factor [Parvibaculum sp.]HUD52485.1 AdeC/AdeK/OprM family multidrug efflux complex outer membrane factor [Parvibaculum sp.]